MNEENRKLPIWYYKELTKTTIDFAIWSLLKETLVVEIEEDKYEVKVSTNKTNKISIELVRYDGIRNYTYTFDEIIEKAFGEGTWYYVTDIDTSKEFRLNYMKNLI